MQRFIFGLLGIAVVLFAFFAFLNTQDGVSLNSATTETAPATQQPETAPAAEQPQAAPAGGIDSVNVTPMQRIPDYDRDLFGDWADTDGNGCRTRDDILARDMQVITTEDGCKVLTGVLNDPYSGQVVNFTFGAQSSQAVQIDHLVSLSAAWKAGAYGWSDEQRLQFANDPRNLLAVDGPTNNSKSDRGPASWMPSKAGNAAYDCEFATKYVDVLVAYNLTAPTDDLTALKTVISSCG